jgi:DNA-directed RNA polymerase subunit RPC12/RpoP
LKYELDFCFLWIANSKKQGENFSKRNFSSPLIVFFFVESTTAMPNRFHFQMANIHKNYDNQLENGELNEKFRYQCMSCQQEVYLKQKDPVICTNYLLVDGKPSKTQCNGTQMIKPARKGYIYRMAR